MLRFRFVFDNTVYAVDLEVRKFLHGSASGPVYGQVLNASRLAETDFLLQAGPAKGTAAARNPVNLPFPVIAPRPISTRWRGNTFIQIILGLTLTCTAAHQVALLFHRQKNGVANDPVSSPAHSGSI